MAARITNALVSKLQTGKSDPLWDWKYWNGVKIGDKVYSLRTISGDLIHSLPGIGDPDNFMFWRLAPGTRQAVESFGPVLGGRKLTLKQAVRENVPIPIQNSYAKYIQNMTKDTDATSSILEAMGIRGEQYRTPEEREALQKKRDAFENRSAGSGSTGPRLPGLSRVPRPGK